MKIASPCFIIATIFALSGCVTNNLPLTPSEEKTQTLIPLITLPSSTFTPPSIATPTSPATLEPEQAKEIIRTLLEEPKDCPAPCFWTITPGETALGEAKNVLAHLGLEIKRVNYEGNDYYGVGYDFDDGLSVTVTLTVQDELVKNLRVDILPGEEKAGDPRGWLAYSPETLVNRYGAPSKVVFALDWGPRSFFEMNMYFDSVDLIVEYTGYNIIPNQKSSPQICPLTAQFGAVHLWLGENPINPPADAVPLEQATFLTMKEFSQLILSNPSKACFTVKSEVFP